MPAHMLAHQLTTNIGFLTTTPPFKTSCPKDGEIVAEVLRDPPKWHHRVNNPATGPTIE